MPSIFKRFKNPEMDYASERKSAAGVRPKGSEVLGTLKLPCTGKTAVVRCVDPEHVRNTQDIDFTMGSNWTHSKFIPKGEIWVANNLKPSDLFPTLVHEAVETDGMLRGYSYEEAHDWACQVERPIRDSGHTVKTRKDAVQKTAKLLGHAKVCK